MNICGTCIHWDEDHYPEPGVGGCFGVPPTALKEMRPRGGNSPIAIAGEGGKAMIEMQMIVASLRPPLGATERACGAYEPRPENGDATRATLP